MLSMGRKHVCYVLQSIIVKPKRDRIYIFRTQTDNLGIGIRSNCWNVFVNVLNSISPICKEKLSGSQQRDWDFPRPTSARFLAKHKKARRQGPISQDLELNFQRVCWQTFSLTACFATTKTKHFLRDFKHFFALVFINLSSKTLQWLIVV